MHTDNKNNLGRRVVTLTGTAKASGLQRWRWMPGMYSTAGLRVSSVGKDGTLFWIDDYGDPVAWDPTVDGTPTPDLDDMPTRGGLLQLVREAWGDPFAQPIHDGSGWRMVGSRDYRGLYGHRSEAQLLVLALEQAPAEKPTRFIDTVELGSIVELHERFGPRTSLGTFMVADIADEGVRYNGGRVFVSEDGRVYSSIDKARDVSLVDSPLRARLREREEPA